MKTLTAVVLMLTAGLLLTACERVTVDNYEKLEVGMSYEEVEKILGKPSNCDTVVNTKSCQWGSEDKYIDAKIVGDSVVFLQAKGLD